MASRAGRERARIELERRELIGTTRRTRVGPSVARGVGERLVSALPAIGPLFTLFGRYLSSRPDRLPLRDCRELASLSPAVDATPTDLVGGVLAGELDGDLRDRLASLADARRVTLLHQWHDATTVDGLEVTIKLVRPQARELIDRELERLPVLEELDIGGGSAAPLVEDFVVWLDRQLDLRREAAGLELLASQSAVFDAIEIPPIVPELCGPSVATTHRIHGTLVAAALGTPHDHRPAVARRLCQAWLQQSLLEGACPEGPIGENWWILADERFAVSGGLVADLDGRARRNLLDAVIAAARDDPDRLCDALLAETAATAGAADRNRVRCELRQAESFRSGGWMHEYSGRRYSDGLFVSWRTLTDLGYRPSSAMVSFIRGFSGVERAAAIMAPRSDTVAAAVDDVRVVAAAASVRATIGPGAVIRAAEELAPVISEILEDPSRLRRPDDRAGRDGADTATAPESSWWAFGGALSVLAAATVLGVATMRAHPDDAWLEWLVVIGFTAAAVGLFKLVGSGADR